VDVRARVVSRIRSVTVTIRSESPSDAGS